MRLFRFFNFTILLFFIVVFFFSCHQKEPFPVTALKTDYSINPIGIDVPAPLLSWQMNDSVLGAKQAAFEVLVASSSGLLKKGKADLWDSGKRAGSLSEIIYEGKPLRSCIRYFWSVRVWDQQGEESRPISPAYFETAYLDSSDWKGKWITGTEDTTFQPAPYFRKVIEIKSGLKHATAYVAGIGYHELYVNSQKVSDTYLEPGYTRFDRRTYYLTYDITNLLSKGENGIGVILGNGWYNVQTKAVWYFEKAPWRKTPRLQADIRLEYADGTVDFISTDESWKWSEGPIRFNSLYAGEIYDARQELGDWSSVDYDDSGWKSALLTESPGGILSAQSAPPIKVIRTIKPVKVYPLANGKYVFDMGQNFAGTACLKIKGERGTKVTMQFGERLNEDYSLNVNRIAVHSRIPPDQLPFQTDVYILKGKGEETYIPRFTYHGYQYVEVKTEPAVELTETNLEGLFLSTGFEDAGSFKCSNELLNKLYAATRQSYRSNFYSIPTDCPHREKNGWTGDAHVSCETGLWNYNGIMAYRKWLQDLRDEQRPSGELPGIVPSSGWGYKWGNGPAWDSALPIIAWTLYEFYGDTTVLQENYEAVKRYVDYLETRTESGILTIGLGDWVSLVETPVGITSTGYYYQDALTLSKMAGILGKENDQVTYEVLAEKIKTAFNKTYLDSMTNHYKVQTQTALSCAVFQELVPDQTVKDNTVSDLIAQIKQRDTHPDFGMLGSKYVLNVLRESGHNELAYKMISQTGYPSWGYWIRRGATTLWEDWKGEASLNHIFLGDFTTWFFKALGGIRIDPASPGFGHFFVKPVFVADISFVECTHSCMQGKIVSNWKRSGSRVKMELTVPANTTASLQLAKVYQLESLKSGITDLPVLLSTKKGIQELELKAGMYEISLTVKVNPETESM